MTVVRWTVGVTYGFRVEVVPHQSSTLSPWLFAMVMDRQTDEVRQESLRTMTFADDIEICGWSREQVKKKSLERWRNVLERRGIKVSCSTTAYMCVNEGETSGMVMLQGVKVEKCHEFKYLGSSVQSNRERAKEVKK